MKSQNTLQDYITRKTYWRILRNTRRPDNKEMNEMVGGIFEQYSFHDYHKTVSLYNKDKSNYWTFNLSDLQQVYGQEVNGKVKYFEKDGYAIGVGDTVVVDSDEYIVFEFDIYGGEVMIRAFNKEKEPFQNTNTFNLDEIDKVIPLQSQPLPMTEEAMIEHLKKVGRIKNGEVVV